MFNAFCGDCAVGEGDLHEEGCDNEICPVCKWQRLMCLSHGKKCDISKAKREPHISKPVLHCTKCGVLYPDFFMVSKDRWKRVCGLTYPLDSVLCRSCFDKVEKIRGESNAVGK